MCRSDGKTDGGKALKAPNFSIGNIQGLRKKSGDGEAIRDQIFFIVNIPTWQKSLMVVKRSRHKLSPLEIYRGGEKIWWW